MNSENIYVLKKYCKENYYKTLVLAKRENANAPESSGNSNPTRTLKRKAYQNLSLYDLWKDKYKRNRKL